MNRPLEVPEVMTLAETAKYLRVQQAQVQRLAENGTLPGQQVDGEWRFLKPLIQEWLRGKPVTSADAFLRQAGALKDDETLPSLLEAIYQARGRPMIE